MATPTILVRKAADIPQYSLDATSAKTHFSSPGAPVRERFGALTVFNDDLLGPAKATQPLSHAYVEIITYIVDGTYRHDDTLGADFVLRQGDVERFSFGSGAGDMATNDSHADDLRSIVLSIDARDRVGEPAINFLSLKRSAVGRAQPLIDIAIDDMQARGHAMALRQRGRVAVGLPGGFDDRIRIEDDYGAYIYAIAGSVVVDDVALAAGDGASVRDAADLKISGDATAHAIVVVVPLKDYEQAAEPSPHAKARVSDRSAISAPS